MPDARSYSIGVDIGGTFTDCAVVGPGGDVFTGKVPTTPEDRSRGFFDSIEAAAARRNLTIGQLLTGTARLAHGTTAGINALVTRQGAATALLATTGHGDAIRIMDNTGRVTGASMEEILDYASSYLPAQYVPAHWIREITERVDAEGSVVTPLDEAQLLETAAALAAEGVESVAVAFLWSHVNPEHEQRAARLIRDAFPELYVSCSHQVAPRIGEYPRTASTLMNAYIGPLMRSYTQRIEEGARARGYTGDVLFATVEGGLVDPATVRTLPITTVQSGPVGGVLGCVALAGQMGFDNVITTDMGGTSLDASVVEAGQALSGDEAVIERHHLYLRRVDVESIGAGGGSIAWCDEATGTIRVGPRSAGAMPGPVCYNRGGTEPTVTDADLVLGFLDPARGLAGRVQLDVAAARRSLEQLGRRIGLSATQCAAGIVQIVDNRMEDLLRRVTLQKGHDPRDFSVWAFGGAAGVHAGLYAANLGVRSIVVPLSELASVWSAYGIALSELSRTFQAPAYLHTPFDGNQLAEAFTKLESDARLYAGQVLPPGAEFELVRKAEMKYAMQWYSVELEAPPGSYDDSHVRSLIDRFEETYERRYGAGSGYSAAGITVTAVGVTMRAPHPAVAAAQAPGTRSSPLAGRQRPVFWLERGDFAATPVYEGAGLVPGNELAGPALIEFADTTIAIRPGQTGRMDSFRNIIIELPGGGQQ
jgi:N-methylhydantoinase A